MGPPSPFSVDWLICDGFIGEALDCSSMMYDSVMFTAIKKLGSTEYVLGIAEDTGVNLYVTLTLSTTCVP